MKFRYNYCSAATAQEQYQHDFAPSNERNLSTVFMKVIIIITLLIFFKYSTKWFLVPSLYCLLQFKFSILSKN